MAAGGCELPGYTKIQGPKPMTKQQLIEFSCYACCIRGAQIKKCTDGHGMAQEAGWMENCGFVSLVGMGCGHERSYSHLDDSCRRWCSGPPTTGSCLVSVPVLLSNHPQQVMSPSSPLLGKPATEAAAAEQATSAGNP